MAGIHYVKVGTICVVQLLIIFKSLGLKEPHAVGGGLSLPSIPQKEKERILE